MQFKLFVSLHLGFKPNLLNMVPCFVLLFILSGIPVCSFGSSSYLLSESYCLLLFPFCGLLLLLLSCSVSFCCCCHFILLLFCNSSLLCFLHCVLLVLASHLPVLSVLVYVFVSFASFKHSSFFKFCLLSL